MSNEFNIKPLHSASQPLGSNSTSTTFYSFYQSSPKAYQLATLLGTGSFSTDFRISGYLYIRTIGTTAASGMEGQGMVDTVSRVISRTVQEFIGSNDYSQPKNPSVPEGAGLFDQATRAVSRTIHEFIGSNDLSSFLKPFTVPESQGMVDQAFRLVSKTIHEFIGSTEVERAQSVVSKTYGTTITALVYGDQVYSTAIQLKSPISANYSTQISGLTQTLVGATATGGTFVTPASGGAPVYQPNPFNPTASVHGTLLFGPTPVVDVSSTTVYINIPNSAIAGLSWKRLYNYGFNLDYAGGSFNLVSLDSVGSLAQQLQIFGLNGTITATGPIVNNQSYGYVTSGIFGSPKLNKQLNLIVAGSLINTGGLTNLTQFLQQPRLQASTIAQAIASTCGISLNWAVRDVPISNFSFESGMNALSALNSLASRCAGVLRWSGNNTYTVAYPDRTFGAFVVPSPYLISAGGIEGQNILDLETGIGGAVSPNSAYAPNQGMYSLPIPAVNQSTGLGISQAPLSQSQGGVSAPTVDPIGTVGRVLTSDDPAYYVPLPPDFLDVYCQILVKPGSTSFGSMVGTIVTDDHNQWFPLPAPGLNSPGIPNQSGLGQQSGRVQYSFVGNSYMPQAVVDYTLFPVGIPPVDAGNFVFSIGVTHRQIPVSANDQVLPLPIQYVRVFQGTINCVFYGVIPIPGMFASATVDSTTISGIIETVSFTPPGLLSIQVAQYRELQYNFPWPSIGPGTS